MKISITRYLTVFMSLLVLLVSGPAMAYVGPGAGLSAIGSFIALLFAIVVAIFGFIWFPVKRLLNRNKQIDEDLQEEELQEGTDK